MKNKQTANKIYSRGRIITYDHVPDDVYAILLQKQLEIRKRKNGSKVSLGQAITALIRG